MFSLLLYASTCQRCNVRYLGCPECRYIFAANELPPCSPLDVHVPRMYHSTASCCGSLCCARVHVDFYLWAFAKSGRLVTAVATAAAVVSCLVQYGYWPAICWPATWITGELTALRPNAKPTPAEQTTRSRIASQIIRANRHTGICCSADDEEAGLLTLGRMTSG